MCSQASVPSIWLLPCLSNQKFSVAIVGPSSECMESVSVSPQDPYMGPCHLGIARARVGDRG